MCKYFSVGTFKHAESQVGSGAGKMEICRNRLETLITETVIGCIQKTASKAGGLNR